MPDDDRKAPQSGSPSYLREGMWVELGGWGDGDVARIDPFAAIELEIDHSFPPGEG